MKGKSLKSLLCYFMSLVLVLVLFNLQDFGLKAAQAQTMRTIAATVTDYNKGFLTINVTSPGGLVTSGSSLTTGGSLTTSTTAATTDTLLAAPGTTVTVTVNPVSGNQLQAGSLQYFVTGMPSATSSIALSGTAGTFTMPDADITITATFEMIPAPPVNSYSITVDSSITNGTILVDKTTATAGDTITVTANANPGYITSPGSLHYTNAANSITPIPDPINGSNTTTFSMPSENITVTGAFMVVPLGTYTANVDATVVNGSISLSPTSGTAGTSISVSVTANAGYVYKPGSLVYKTSNGTSVPITDPSSGTTSTSFDLPSDNVSVFCVFEAISTGSFLINDGSAYTNDPTVWLSFTTNGYPKAQIANDSSVLDTTTQVDVSDTDKYQWTLTPGDGVKTVYVRFIPPYAPSLSALQYVSKTITLDTEKPVVSGVQFNQSFYNVNDYINIVAASPEKGLIAEAEILDASGTVLKTVSMGYIGQNTAGTYDYSTTVKLESASYLKVRVKMKDLAGNVSDPSTKDIAYVQQNDIRGRLMMGSSGAYYRYVDLYKVSDNGTTSYYGSTQTDWNGNFYFYKVPSGTYQIRATGDYYRYNDFVSNNITVSISSDIGTFNFVSKYPSISSNISVLRSDGSPIGAHIYLYNWNHGIYNYYSAPNGTVTATDLPQDSGYYMYIYDLNWNYIGSKNYFTISNSLTYTLPNSKTLTGTAYYLDANGTKVPMSDIYVSASSVYPYDEYHGVGAYTDANGQYTLDLREGRTYSIYSYNWSGKYSDYPYAAVNNHQVSMDSNRSLDVEFYKANKIFGKIMDSTTGAFLPNVWLYNYSSNGYYGDSVSANDKGEYSIKAGRGDISMYAYDWSWRYEYFYADKNSTPAVPSFSNTDSGVNKEYNISLRPWGVSSAFNGGGNSVVTSQEVVQKGNRNIKVKVNYQNNSGRDLSNVNIKAMRPQGVSLSSTGNNLDEITLPLLKAGESGSFNFMINVDESFVGDSISIPVNANFDGSVSNIGTAYLKVIYVKLSGNPVAEKSKMYTIYGEATPGTEITVYLKDDSKPNKKGKVVGTGTPNGKWYTIKFTAPSTDGTYTYFAESKYKEDRAISNDITVKVDDTTPFVKDVALSSSGGTKSGVNESTGVASYTAFVNGALQGRDISVELTLGNADAYTSATVRFAGREYTATKDTNGVFKATVSGWSGSGTKSMEFKVGDLVFTIAEVVILIDPSGYVFDAYSGQLLSGALAECYELVNGNWVQWNAQKYGQVNPQITLDDGKYGWMVPEGSYRVVVKKPGYQTFDTLKTITGSAYNYNDLTVLPERLDINIGLISTDQPIVVSSFPENNGTLAKDGTIKVLFNKAVDLSTLTAQNIVVTKVADGSVISGTIEPIQQVVSFKAEHTAIQETYVMGFKFTANPNEFESGQRYNVTLERISDLPLRAEDVNTPSTFSSLSGTNTIFKTGFVFNVADSIAYLANPSLGFAEGSLVPIDASIKLNFAEAINPSSANNATIKLVSGKGAAVEGDITVTGQEIEFKPSSTLDYSMNYTVKVNEFVQSTDKKVLQNPYEASFMTVNATVTNPEVPAPPVVNPPVTPTQPPMPMPTPTPTPAPPYYTGSSDTSSDSSSSSTSTDVGTPTVVEVKNTVPGQVNWGKIIATAKSAKANTIIEANMEKDTKLPADLLKAIKGKNVSVKLLMGEFTWVINGRTVEDVGTQATFDMQVIKLNDKKLSALAENTDLLQIQLKHNGAFPFAAKLYFMLDKNLAGTKAYLLYQGQNNMEYSGQATVDRDGIVCFTFTHASTYLVTNSILKSMRVEEVASTAFMVPYYVENGSQKLVKLSKPNGKYIEFIAPKTAAYNYKNNLKVYTDIYGHWASDSIQFVSARELFYGVTDKEFAPDNSMTRAMFVTVLGRLYGVDTANYADNNSFSDVANGEWFTPYVLWAAENKIVSGVGGDLFDPYAPVTHEQMALIVANYSQFINHSYINNSSTQFTDASKISSWAYGAVSTLNGAGLLGFAKDTFQPQAESTRAEISTVLHRMIESIVE